MPLTPDIPIDQRKKLAELKRNLNRSELDRPQGLPVIGEETVDSVISRFNMGRPFHEFARSSMGMPNSNEHPFKIGEQLAAEYIDLFIGKNQREGFGFLVTEWLTEHFRNMGNSHSLEDNASVGMAYILNSFHTQLGPNFVDRLEHLDPRFSPPIVTLKSNYPKFSDSLSLPQRGRNKYSIPGFQMHLKRGLSRLLEYAPCEHCVEDGAIFTYNALEAVWPSLQTQRKTGTIFEK